MKTTLARGDQTVRADNRPLNGWKDIADYLGITVRTAQNWERTKGLKVHRTGGKRPRVHSLPRELDEWLERGPGLRFTLGRIRARWVMLVLGSSLLVLLALGTNLLYRTSFRPDSSGPTLEQSRAKLQTEDPRRASFCSVVGSELQILDEEGGMLWRKYLPLLKSPYYQHELELGDRVALDRLCHITAGKVLFGLLAKGTNDHQVLCFDTSGQEQWRFAFGSTARQLRPELQGYYQGEFIVPVSNSRGDFVVAVSSHDTDHPAQVALLDQESGTLLAEYWHPGRFRGYLKADLDQDADEELLLYGFNNPTGLGHPAMVVLNIPFDDSLGNTNRAENYYGADNAREADYFLFPRIEALSAERSKTAVVYAGYDARGNISVVTGAPMSGIYWFYTFDPLLERILDYQASDDLKARHRALFNRRVIRYQFTDAIEASMSRFARFPTAPDGNVVTTLDQTARKN